jgi:hypothetical protein
MSVQPAMSQWWTEAIQKRLEWLSENSHIMDSNDIFKAIYLINDSMLGPRHELNQNGKLHADLIKLTDKWGYRK